MEEPQVRNSNLINNKRKRDSRSASPEFRRNNIPSTDQDQAKPNQFDNTNEMPNDIRLEQKMKEIILPTRSGGVYIPPFKMAKILEQIREKNDTKSLEYQRMMWEMLRKSINGIINKLNVSNIHNVIYELLNENLIRGMGLLCRSIIKSQMASPNFTHVYACLVAVLNTKLPDFGELILSRYVLQFQRAFKRNNKIMCTSTMRMIAHLVNQQVNSETLAFEILFLFLENPTEDSVELACEFMIECGQFLSEVNTPLIHSIFERFRSILHEGGIDKRIQYTIENLFAIRKTNFKDHPAILPELDIVADEDKITHTLSLDDTLNPKDELDIFKFEENYEEKDNLWLSFKAEILGEPVNPNLALNQEEEEEQQEEEANLIDNNQNEIIDFNETDLVKLRRTIYLTIISSVDFQECCHKLLKLNMREGQEMELINMIIECCIQERTYLRFYGLLAERLCKVKEAYKQNFELQFENQYIKVHRLETNKLRNLAKLFGHLLYTDSIDWSVFKIIKLTEEDTTSSSRIFIKIIFQELSEYLGLEELNDRLQNENQRENFLGLFPRDNPQNTRFSINFFTSIGLGALTQQLREFLANAEKMITDQRLRKRSSTSELEESESGSDSESDSGSDEKNSSESESESSSSISKSNSNSSSFSSNTEKIIK